MPAKPTDTTFILLHETEMLMQQRTETNPQGEAIRYPLAWVFPGGRIEEGESPEECVRREVPEEFGISIEGLDLFHLGTYPHDGDIDFVCVVDVSHIPRDQFVLKEGVRMDWMDLNKIHGLSLGFEQEKILPFLVGYLARKK